MDYGASHKTIERTVLLVLLALVLFASPVIVAWAQDDSPWYTPYILWLMIIVGVARVSSRRKDV